MHDDGSHDDGFDRFDWPAWAEDDPAQSPAGADDSNGSNGSDGPNGHRAIPGERAPSADESAASAGWVSSGGVLRWDEPDDAASDPLAEAESPLAADDIALPEGAPDAPRVRAVRAWMLRQRARARDALGDVLLAQREQRAGADAPPSRHARRREPDISPLDLALAEQQAAEEEYDALLTALEDHAAHSGPGRVLIEYFLWVSDRLATLAAAPEAAQGDAPPATREAAAWRGRALAALAARRRVERVSAPSTED